VQHAIDSIVQVIDAGDPVIYPASRLPRLGATVAFLNPMATIITTYRAMPQSAGPRPGQLLA